MVKLLRKKQDNPIGKKPHRCIIWGLDKDRAYILDSRFSQCYTLKMYRLNRLFRTHRNVFCVVITKHISIRLTMIFLDSFYMFCENYSEHVLTSKISSSV